MTPMVRRALTRVIVELEREKGQLLNSAEWLDLLHAVIDECADRSRTAQNFATAEEKAA